MFGLYRAKDYERMVVFRLGRFLDVCGPGLFLTIPLVDRVMKVNLNDSIPGWQDIPEGELERRLRQINEASPLPAYRVNYNTGTILLSRAKTQYTPVCTQYGV